MAPYALSIMLALLDGVPLWGEYRVRGSGPVVLIDEETPASFLKDRMRMGFREDMPLHVSHFAQFRLDDDLDVDALIEKLKEINPVLVVFDALIRFHRMQENVSNEWRR